MNLTADDLLAIRSIVREEVNIEVNKEINNAFRTYGREIIHEEICSEIFAIHQRLDIMEEKLSRVDALENDVNEVYYSLKRVDKNFREVSSITNIELPFPKII